MSTDKKIDPRADMLMGSMRSMGYSFEAAVADIIDNSISAKCSNVHILFPSTPMDTMAVGILDDGIGMPQDTLVEAMRYGSFASEDEREEDDLGRFGLGLKSASLSQCKVLTVVSIYDGLISAFSWDYDYIVEKRDWIAKELTQTEIKSLPYYKNLDVQNNGTLVIWQEFDVLDKSSEGLVFDALNDMKDKLDQSLGLVFHRFLSGSSKKKLTFYINNHKIKPQDPFLESHPKTTTKKLRTIALRDTKGVERHINIKPFILPYISDLSDKDKKLIGGIENLRTRQGFYIYRNNRLIIWGTWFGMKPRAELTKNARIRVDIPNSLDDIWSIDIKKQTAAIPKRIQQQLKNTVIQALEISTAKQTHRGRKDKAEDDKEYIWERFKDRTDAYYYQVNRDSKLFQYVRSKMSDSDFDLMEVLLTEIEKNLPIQQLYIDKSNEKISTAVDCHRADEVFQSGVSIVSMIQAMQNKPYAEIIDDIMKSEPYCYFVEVKDRLLKNFSNETD